MPPQQQHNPNRPEQAKGDPAPAVGPAAGQTPGEYLQARGWRALGEPSWPSCLWLDPTKPIAEETVEVPIFAWNQDGTVYARVMVYDGKPNSEIKVPAVRKVVRPAGQPVDTPSAILAQTERDLAKARGEQALGKKRQLELDAIRQAGAYEAFRRAGLVA